MRIACGIRWDQHLQLKTVSESINAYVQNSYVWRVARMDELIHFAQLSSISRINFVASENCLRKANLISSLLSARTNTSLNLSLFLMHIIVPNQIKFTIQLKTQRPGGCNGHFHHLLWREVGELHHQATQQVFV
jgi:hypothetical protein